MAILLRHLAFSITLCVIFRMIAIFAWREDIEKVMPVTVKGQLSAASVDSIAPYPVRVNTAEHAKPKRGFGYTVYGINPDCAALRNFLKKLICHPPDDTQFVRQKVIDAMRYAQ